MIVRVTSASNTRVRIWQQARNGKGVLGACWLPEGVRLCCDAWSALRRRHALDRVRGILVSDSAVHHPEVAALLQECAQEQRLWEAVLQVPDSLFARFSDTVHPQGILLAVDPPQFDFRGMRGSRILVLERLQDPGNLGACCRSADALGFDAVFLTGGGVRPNNSKALRAGMGAFFHIPVYTIPEPIALLQDLQQAGFSSIAAALDAPELTPSLQSRLAQLPRVALWIGNEGDGLSLPILERVEHRVRLRMDVRAESLNAACAASIFCYLFSPHRQQDGILED